MLKFSESENIINQALRDFRIALGVTQEQFAKEVEYSKPYISKIEQNQIVPSNNFLHKVISTFGEDLIEDMSPMLADYLFRQNWMDKEHRVADYYARIEAELSDLPDITCRIFLTLSKRQMTQKELAKKTGISKSTISMWRKNGGIPSSQHIMPICEALGVTPYYLLTGHEVDCPLAKAMNLDVPPCVNNGGMNSQDADSST